MFRDAMRLLLTRSLGISRTAEADSFESLKRHFENRSATDFVLLDLDMPGADGFSCLNYLRTEHPRLPVVVVSGHEEADVMRRALELGARAYVPKSLPIVELADVLRLVLNGETWVPPAVRMATKDDTRHDPASRIPELTPMQFRVLMLVAEGRLNKQIASELNMAEATVKWHVTLILRQLGLRRRTEAAIAAQRMMQVSTISSF